MREGNVGGFWTLLNECSGLDPNCGARDAISAIILAGGNFVRGGESYELDVNPYLITQPRPSGKVDADGCIMSGVRFRHPALRMDRTSCDDYRTRKLPPDTPPIANLFFLQDCRAIGISQDALLEDQRMVDPLALGQLLLACDLCQRLQPMYGWIDERGDNLPTSRQGGLGPTNLRYLFWANFFGPAHVEVLGRQFLEQAPGWRLVDLPDGGVIYVVSESYLEWWHEDRNDVVQYFRHRHSNIEQYRAEDHGW